GRVANQRPERHEYAGDDRRRRRNLRPRVDEGRPSWQQSVARHGEEDARLAVLEHQQHGGHRHGRAERDEPADGAESGELALTPASWSACASGSATPGSLYGTMAVSTAPTTT